jgi:hypothetical protein
MTSGIKRVLIIAALSLATSSFVHAARVNGGGGSSSSSSSTDIYPATSTALFDSGLTASTATVGGADTSTSGNKLWLYGAEEIAKLGYVGTPTSNIDLSYIANPVAFTTTAARFRYRPYTGGSGEAARTAGFAFTDGDGNETANFPVTGNYGMYLLSTGTVRFYDADSSNFVSLAASPTVSGFNPKFTLPVSTGTYGQVWSDDGGGGVWMQSVQSALTTGSTIQVSSCSATFVTATTGTFRAIFVDSPTIYTDAINHRLGVGTTSPASTLTVSQAANGEIARFISTGGTVPYFVVRDNSANENLIGLRSGDGMWQHSTGKVLRVEVAGGALGTLSAQTLKAGGLTSGRITYATTSGQLTDNAAFTVTGATLNVAGSIQCDAIMNDTGLAAGVYTPTRSAEVNFDASVSTAQCQYMRVGNTVTVSGSFTADPTAGGTASFEITLPVASNIGVVGDLSGVAFCGAIAGQGAQIYGSVANNTAVITWTAVDTTNQTWSFTFTYRVI